MSCQEAQELLLKIAEDSPRDANALALAGEDPSLSVWRRLVRCLGDADPTVDHGHGSQLGSGPVSQ